MKKEDAAEMLANATKAAKRYKRKCWWVDLDDLEQEAITAQLEAACRYNPTLGPWGGYAWRVAVQHLKRYILAQSSPVTYKGTLPSKAHPDRGNNGYTETRREALDTDHSMMHTASISEEVVSLKRVRDRVEEVVGQDNAMFVFGVLGEGWKPSEVAEAHGIPVRDVYRDVEQLKTTLQADKVLRNVWREL